MIWVGVDVGGTFTDIVVYDGDAGEIRSGKSPSTPHDTAAGVLRALEVAGVDLARVERLRHGATVATNTALERSGALLGVVTTAGHRDVLIVGRGNRTRLYDIKAIRPPGLVKRSHIFEVPQRTGPDGKSIVALDESALAAAAEQLRGVGVEAVAVCFLHAYANPEDEIRASEIVSAGLPGVPVSRSSEVLPEQREYERFATTALNAYVAPRMAQYLSRLQGELSAGGLRVAPEIMTSSGGSWPFDAMARLPVNSMLSGPAGGVIGAVGFAASLGVRDLITYDMGGTSTDTCLVRDGRYELAMEGAIGGLPNRAAQIEINTVGAGGGSIAYLDEGGFLNVGPRSAGALPGPACYGRGGAEPTVTDANVVLGRFRPDQPLGGEIAIDARAAEHAVDQLAGRLGLDRMATAEGILRLAVTRMTGAIKEVSVMRGIDPRDFTLLAFGGAGPLHAAAIALELGMSKVIVPPLPGTFSAYGLLVADRRRDAAVTRVMPAEKASLEDVKAVVEPMREQAEQALRREGFAPERIRCDTFVDMRFAGQAFDLTTPLPPGARTIDDLIAAFHDLYEQRYAHADSGLVELVCFRVAAYGLTDKPRMPEFAVAGAIEEALVGTRAIHFDGKTRDAAVYRRDLLPAGVTLTGPAVVDEDGSATVVPPGFELEGHVSGALIMTLETT